MTEEIVRAAGAGAGTVLAVVTFSAELLTAVAGEPGQTFALPVHRVAFPLVQAVTVVSTVRPELLRPAGRVTELSRPAPGTVAGAGQVVAVASPAGTAEGAVRPVVAGRAGLQAVETCGAGQAVTASSDGVAALSTVTGGAALLAVQSEGPRAAGVLALCPRVSGLAPTLPSVGVAGGSRLAALTVQAAVLAPPSLLTDGVAPLPPPPVATLTPPRDGVAALAVLLLAVAAMLAVEAEAPRPAGQLTVNPLEAGQTDTFASLVAAPVVLALTFLLTVLSKPSLRTGGVTVGSRPASRTRTLKHHGLCQPEISNPALHLTLPDTGSQGASLAQRHCWPQSFP